jgi:hypothetical protein
MPVLLAPDVNMAPRLLNHRHPRSVATLAADNTSHRPDGGLVSPIVMYGRNDLVSYAPENEQRW